MKKGSVNRRGFLKGAAAGAAALVAQPTAKAEAQQAAQPTQTRPAVGVPNAAQLAAETGPPQGAQVERIIENPGSDFMMDVIKSLNFEYITTNPGSSFQGLHESIINYAGNKPELLSSNPPARSRHAPTSAGRQATARAALPPPRTRCMP